MVAPDKSEEVELVSEAENSQTIIDANHNPHCLMDAEWVRFSHYGKSFLSIYGAILYWVGFWDLCLQFESVVGRAAVCWLSFTVGLAFCIATDSLYANAGIVGYWQSPATDETPRRYMALRTSFALCGTVLLWIGCYNSINYFFLVDTNREYEAGTVFDIQDCGGGSGGNSTEGDAGCEEHREYYVLKDALCCFLGFALLAATRTFFPLAMITVRGDPANRPEIYAVDHKSSCRDHILTSCRAVTSVFGQCSLWVALWNFAEYYGTTTFLREVAYVAIGLASFFALKTFHLHGGGGDEGAADSSGEDGGAGQQEKEGASQARDLSLCLVGRGILAHCTSVIHLVGAWTLLDLYLVPYSFTGNGVGYTSRNLLYVAVGAGCLVASGSVASAACVSPIHLVPWHTPEDRGAKEKDFIERGWAKHPKERKGQGGCY